MFSLPANVAERLCHLHTCIAQGGTKFSLNATSGLIRLVMDLEIRGVYGALEYLILGCKTSNRYAGTDNVKVHPHPSRPGRHVSFLQANHMAAQYRFCTSRGTCNVQAFHSYCAEVPQVPSSTH